MLFTCLPAYHPLGTKPPCWRESQYALGQEEQRIYSFYQPVCFVCLLPVRFFHSSMAVLFCTIWVTSCKRPIIGYRVKARYSLFQGFITGIGKGIVGTFAKPTAGVLDFASGAAAAVRGQATRSTRNFMPKPSRLRRNCFGPSGAIPRFAATHAEGQEIMLKLNEGNFNEK